MTEFGAHVSVRDRADRHLVEHLGVLSNLVLFKSVYGELTLVDRDEVNQFPVLLNLYVGLLDL